MARANEGGTPGRRSEVRVASGHARPEQGHWVLAQLGKRVLRPGGLELTRTLLSSLPLRDAEIVEFAPGLGRTAQLLLAGGPARYTGVDSDPAAARKLENVLAGRGVAVVADAASTGLPDASADVIVGEAMLTMQSPRGKAAIVAEAARVLRPGGYYGIHEMALDPDSLPESVKTDIQRSLAQAIKVNARPLTVAEWTQLLQDAGLEVRSSATAPMSLLEPKRLLADEGPVGAARFVWNLLRKPLARRRVLAMRRTFRQHQQHLSGVALVAYKPVGTD